MIMAFEGVGTHITWAHWSISRNLCLFLGYGQTMRCSEAEGYIVRFGEAELKVTESSGLGYSRQLSSITNQIH